ncbi:MAG: D-alanyl-D-alanine carboxypeptidase [Desulfobacteraceae bacterium]|nr:D-alanyl-D-alanine carboxypeptidase [Desulfobacteraceae bacterium]MBC2757982.1 D-alanyl-D-alanine carboxypeptidase [Desulfobacteraceae bacterium]
MGKSAFIFLISTLATIIFICSISPALGLKKVSKTPYLGAIVVDAETGKVILEDHADAKGYPASMIKLMNLLVILDAVKAQHISLDDPVSVSAKVSRMGGSQVYLKEKEVFSVEELIYAMMVQSANDAALALAVHYTGSMEVFVDLMNKKAKEIGMSNTVFHSVHGLPPSGNNQPDVTTARDMAKLSRELLKYPEALKYTSIQVREFRPDIPEPFIMRTHNHLLKDFEGCDGLKTGYFRAAGFSIAATAQKKDVRAIAVILGSVSSKERDKHARLLLSKGLMEILINPPAAAGVKKDPVPTEVEPADPAKEVEYIRIPKRTFKVAVTLNAAIIILLFVALYFQRSKGNRLR